ncbi:MAG: altronate oxidoreductase, partial [Leadbetterella sp.]|nr:altronate oxidoreductase [Leadbetterella sp.]
MTCLKKVLQFGTGVLLRGLPDYIIDKANKAGIFNGRIVVVKSTGQGGTDAFAEQDNLYTVCVRGISGDRLVKENVINTAVSRVLTASVQWEEVLAFAESDSLEVVISNTTEVGIVFTEENVLSGVPASFPGKLLAVLYHRYRHFRGDAGRGLVIVPTELISDNGDKLRRIVLELA